MVTQFKLYPGWFIILLWVIYAIFGFQVCLTVSFISILITLCDHIILKLQLPFKIKYIHRLLFMFVILTNGTYKTEIICYTAILVCIFSFFINIQKRTIA